jgi:hypothetical protein
LDQISSLHDAFKQAMDAHARAVAAFEQVLKMNAFSEPEVVEPVVQQSVELDPDTWLTRADTGENLRKHRFRISNQTLRTLACKGGGPPYRKWGRLTMYRWGDVVEWAQNRLSEPRRNTSEEVG